MNGVTCLWVPTAYGDVSSGVTAINSLPKNPKI